MCPQQNDNFNEQRRMEELQRRRSLDRPSIGSSWGSWWILPVVIFFIGLLWFAGWGWGSYGGWWWGARTRGGFVQPANNGNTGNANNGALANNNGMNHQANGNPALPGNQTATNQTNGSNAGQTNAAAILTASNKQGFVGQQFEVSSTPVVKKVDDRVFWVGQKNDSSPLLVVMASAANKTATSNLHDGESLNLVGTVEKPPAEAQAMHQWHLDHASAARLEKEGAYVRATQAAETHP